MQVSDGAGEVGLLVGIVNGFLVVRMRLNAFIVTLAMDFALSGIVLAFYQALTQATNAFTVKPAGMDDLRNGTLGSLCVGGVCGPAWFPYLLVISLVIAQHAVASEATREAWAALARDLGIKVMHIAERDTQLTDRPKEVGEFVNTWSVDGFISEGSQPAELGWGTHEKSLPADGRTHAYGSGAAIYLMQPGAATRVRTWTPLAGAIHGFLITHGESISISDYYTVKQGDTVVSRWHGLGSGYKEIEIWLPTASSVELIDVRIDDGATAKAVPSRRRRWVHYGSSISHCMDVDRPLDAWPPMVARQLGLELTDFGLAGQCQLDPFMGRVIRDTEADVISLKVGINLVNHASMTERTFAPALHGFIDTIREAHPTTPLVIVSPIACPMVETHAGPTVPAGDGYEVVTTILGRGQCHSPWWESAESSSRSWKLDGKSATNACTPSTGYVCSAQVMWRCCTTAFTPLQRDMRCWEAVLRISPSVWAVHSRADEQH